MKIFVTAEPKSKQIYFRKIDKENFVVAVKEAAEDGKANDAVIRALTDHLQIEPYQLRITSGHNARKKIIEILEILFSNSQEFRNRTLNSFDIFFKRSP